MSNQKEREEFASLRAGFQAALFRDSVEEFTRGFDYHTFDRDKARAAEMTEMLREAGPNDQHYHEGFYHGEGYSAFSNEVLQVPNTLEEQRALVARLQNHRER